MRKETLHAIAGNTQYVLTGSQAIVSFDSAVFRNVLFDCVNPEILLSCTCFFRKVSNKPFTRLTGYFFSQVEELITDYR